jgi:hypothetical protein
VLRVLVDHSVRRRSVFLQPARPQIVEGLSNLLMGCEAVPPISGEWLREQVACIPTVGRLARQGHIQLCRSHELWLEGARGRDFLGKQPGYAFEGCAWEDLKLPIEPSRFWPLFGDELRDMETLRSFCAWLLKAPDSVSLVPPSRRAKLTAFEEDNIRRIRCVQRHLS